MVAQVANLSGIKRGRSQMVSFAVQDMFDALRYMKGGKSGRKVLLKAFQLVVQSGVGDNDELLYDRPCPPPRGAQFQRQPPVTAEMAQAGPRQSRTSISSPLHLEAVRAR